MKRTSSLLPALLGTAGVLGLGVAAYAAKYEPEHLTITRPVLQHTPPVKTLFFSDVHVGAMYHYSHLEPIVTAINAEQPQLVLFGGDFFSKFLRDAPHMPFAYMKTQLNRIKAPLGKYAVLGNHELRDGCGPFFELLFSEGGFTVLQDEIATPAPGISICGLSPYSNGKIMHQLPSQGWRITLCHMPDKCRYLPLHKTDLVLAGHTHNGQIRLPIITDMILPPGGKLYPYGSYHPQGNDSAELFVSRGIGMSGVPFRLGCPPELVVLE